MRASIVTTVLDSHEVVRRQILYLNTIMPDGVEWILVDDGSDPPIHIDDCEFPVVLHRTNDFRPWTERKARAEGVQLCKSERLICVDIDHIVTAELILFVVATDYDFIKFRRKFAVLDESGMLCTDVRSVQPYGLSNCRINRWGLKATPPGNCYAMSKELFSGIGSERRSKGRFRRLKHVVSGLAKQGKATICRTDERPMVYAFPNGRYCGDIDANPLGLFHNLSRRSEEYSLSEDMLI